MKKSELLEKTAKVKAAQRTASTALDDATAIEAMAIFDEWAMDTAYAVNDRIRYADKLYRCVQAHTSQTDWTPDNTPALWVEVSVDEYPEWVQPTGAHDAYNIGDRVTYNGQRYVCTTSANVYAPDVYGWQLVNA